MSFVARCNSQVDVDTSTAVDLPAARDGRVAIGGGQR
jgi:hypothetical protein